MKEIYNSFALYFTAGGIKTSFAGSFPNYKQNVEIVKEYFKGRIGEITYEQPKPGIIQN